MSTGYARHFGFDELKSVRHWRTAKAPEVLPDKYLAGFENLAENNALEFAGRELAASVAPLTALKPLSKCFLDGRVYWRH